MTPLPRPSALERELREQPAALEARAGRGLAAASEAAGIVGEDSVDYLLIAARGSSDNAARFAQYALGVEARLNVALAAPSLFAEPDRAPDLRGAAVLGISQSGQSPDIVSVLAAARRQGRPTVALTNDEGSPLAAVADVTVPLAAGPEESVAATKTYIASIHAIEQLIQCLRPSEERAAWLERLPGLLGTVVEEQLERRAAFTALNAVRNLTCVGRGVDYSTAHETALKIRELSALVAEPFSPADLLHGPVAALHRGGALWVIDTNPRPDESVHSVLRVARARGARTVVVSAKAASEQAPTIAIGLPAGLPRWLAALLAVVPGQVAGLQLATLRGVDLDKPNSLSKVTLTR